MRLLPPYYLLFSLLMGCAAVNTGPILINPNAPENTTKYVIIAKIKPTWYTSESVVVALDKNGKEIHYDVHHEDLSIISDVIAIIAGVGLGKI